MGGHLFSVERRLAEFQQFERLKYSELEKAKRKEFEFKSSRLGAIPGQDCDMVSRLVDAWQDCQAAIVEGWIDIRQDLAMKEPGLVTDNELTLFQGQLESLVMVDQNHRLEKVQQFARGRECSPTALLAIAEQSKPADYETLARMRNRIAQMRIEFRNALHQLPEKNVKIELNNSTINQLNLGNVMGDMNNSVTSLQQAGHAEIAQALKHFTEQVAASDLPADTKKEIIENLALVGEQAVLPSEKMKTGPIKAALSYVTTAITATKPLLDLWKTFGPAIEEFFKHHHP